MSGGTSAERRPPPPPPCRTIVPIGALYSCTLWLGNAAYLFLSVSFIQMLKVPLRRPTPATQQKGVAKGTPSVHCAYIPTTAEILPVIWAPIGTEVDACHRRESTAVPARPSDWLLRVLCT